MMEGKDGNISTCFRSATRHLIGIASAYYGIWAFHKTMFCSPFSGARHDSTETLQHHTSDIKIQKNIRAWCSALEVFVWDLRVFMSNFGFFSISDGYARVNPNSRRILRARMRYRYGYLSQINQLDVSYSALAAFPSANIREANLSPSQLVYDNTLDNGQKPFHLVSPLAGKSHVVTIPNRVVFEVKALCLHLAAKRISTST